MAYDQYMRHSKNHNKDGNYQQCGFSMKSDDGSPIRSAAAIAAELGAPWYVVDKNTGERLSDDIYDEDKAWDIVIKIDKENPKLRVGLYTHGLPYYG